MAAPPLNIAYWALQYSAQQDPDETYTTALEAHSQPLDRAVALWDWKDLSRGVPVENITAAVTNDELHDLCNEPPAKAVATLADRLIVHDALANRTTVTPVFLLHLADSGPDHYSLRFPIFDVRCWVAYLYLTRGRDYDQPLPRSATRSPARFGEFSQFFQETLPETVNGRAYEQALFRFGAYISGLPAETIGEIDEHLRMIEDAISEAHTRRGFALVRPGNTT